MSRTLPLLTAVVLSLLFVALAACGDGGGEATQTPAEPTATTAAQTPTPGTTATQAPTPTPVGREFSESATVSAKVGDNSLTFENATCVKGPDDAWLGVSTGEVGSAEYFLLVVGNLGGQEGSARSAKGGGDFTGQEIAIVTGAQSGTSFFMRLSEQDKVTVAADLRSGEFTGAALDGQVVSGSFEC